jgi:uncharacterized repeat protein (TIGR03803 family)
VVLCVTLTEHPRCFTNSDGACPTCGLVLLDHDLFGTTPAGSTNGLGTVFKIGTDGSGFTVLHVFPSLASGTSGAGNPAGMILWDNFLYGTPPEDFNRSGRSVFKIRPDGTGFTWLPFFTSDAAMGPVTGLLPSGDRFYGTTLFGGTNGGGIVFKSDLNGASTIVIHNFVEKWRVDKSIQLLD